MLGTPLNTATVEDMADELNRRDCRFVLVVEHLSGDEPVESYADGGEEFPHMLVGMMQRMIVDLAMGDGPD